MRACAILACVFAAGLVRSLTHTDIFIYAVQIGKPETDVKTIYSADGYFIWYNGTSLFDDIVYWYAFKRTSENAFEIEGFLAPETTPLLRAWTGIGIGQRGDAWAATYWNFIAPLTLLSAWLLLSKPRKPILS